MKILMFTSSYPTKLDPSSGPFIKNLAEGLSKIGFQISVLTFSKDNKLRISYTKKIEVIEYPYTFLLPPRLHIHRGLIPTIKKDFIAKIQLPLYLVNSFKYFELISKNFDIVHAHWYIPCGYISCIRKTKPLVTTAWGAEFHIPKNYFVKKILNKVHLNSDSVIAVSNYMKCKASEYDLNIEKIKVIPNCVDTNIFKPKRKSNQNNKIIIGVLRRLVPEKRVEDLIMAIKLLDENTKNKCEVWVIGDGPEKHKLQKIVYNFGLKNIKFFGMIPYEKIPDILSRIDIVVNPSIQEGMATANLEAMSSGCVLVATRGFGNDEIIDNEKTGFLYEPKNYRELSNIISILIRNQDIIKNIGKKSRRKIINNYSLKIISNLYKKIYEEII